MQTSGRIQESGFSSLLPAQAGEVLVVASAFGSWQEYPQTFEAWLTDSDRARARQKKSPRLQAQLEIAYALHRRFLAAMLGCSPEQVPLERDALGAPRLAGMQASTSLSHGGEAVAMAYCRELPVGVDIEPLANVRLLDGLAATVCHPREMAHWQGLASTDSGRYLLELWTRKEALLKAAGIGLAHDMNRFRVGPGALALHELQPGLAGIASTQLLPVHADYLVALAADPAQSVRWHWLAPDDAQGD